MCFWYFLHDKTTKLFQIMLIFGQYIYIYLNSTRQELSNDMSHDTLSQLYQKLVTY